MRKKCWIMGGVLAVMLISLCFFGVRLRIAPRMILSRALGSALEQLEDRFEDSPVHLLMEVLDPAGRQRAAIQLETEVNHLGPVVCDMTIQTQIAPNRIQAEGSVATGDKLLDIGLFLNENFAAVSSRGLLEGQYYGITYDTFSQDIRNRKLLTSLLGEEIIVGWEDSVSGLDTAMSWNVKQPKWDTEDIVRALYGVLTLKPQVSRVETPAGPTAKTDAVIFRATGQEIWELAAPYRDQLSPALLAVIEKWNADASAFVEVKFFLHKGNLVEIHVLMETAAENTSIFVTLGTAPETNQLVLEIKTASEENYDRTRLEIDTVSDEEKYQEKLWITQTKNRAQTTASLEYTYDLSTGEMDMSILRDEEKARLRLNLTEEEDGLIIRSQNVTPLVNLFLKTPLESPAICTLHIWPGREVTVPEYRNLDQWSVEDLLTLLAGFGDLLGLKLP